MAATLPVFGADATGIRLVLGRCGEEAAAEATGIARGRSKKGLASGGADVLWGPNRKSN
ncbi:MAG TPA: hypothetical protein P5555_13035 [Candidatus Paceibacterota bacterium]|nr:hypothetical protein [Verrucomicrobiota bacterium]HRZ46108.1 hypothetical protein [Candidatus Paceibacterota bacterium]